MERFYIQLGRSDGEIKPLSGVNCAPFMYNQGDYVTKVFQAGRIPYSRLHDCMWPYGGYHFIDIPCIFRDFDADEADPASYDFTLSDEYISCIIAAGTKIVYRLGVSIDHSTKPYHLDPPRDYAKWARICEHIIRHYNEGWADGHCWSIEDWEIWNEPENPSMWRGSVEDYYRLYVQTAKHLKQCFPELHIGGYGSCGFYATTRPDACEWYRSFLPFFHGFLDYVKAKGAPLDFFSWHIYTDDPEEIYRHALYARRELDQHGFVNTLSSLNEWNYGAEGKSNLEKKTMVGASFVSSVMTRLQESGVVDSALYYCASRTTSYNGLTRMEDGAYFKPFYTLAAWGKLAELGAYHRAEGNNAPGLYCCCASGGEEAGVLLTNIRDEEAWVEVSLEGLKQGTQAAFYLLDETCDMEKTRTEIFRGQTAVPVVRLPARSVMYLALSPEEAAVTGGIANEKE